MKLDEGYMGALDINVLLLFPKGEYSGDYQTLSIQNDYEEDCLYAPPNYGQEEHGAFIFDSPGKDKVKFTRLSKHVFIKDETNP